MHTYFHKNYTVRTKGQVRTAESAGAYQFSTGGGCNWPAVRSREIHMTMTMNGKDVDP